MLNLGRDDIRRLVPMPDAIDLMKSAFEELWANRAQSPLRTSIELPENRTTMLTMPASVPVVGALGVKIVSVATQNPERGLPLIHAIVLMVSPDTGIPEAILDGTTITALRTGAVSGAATDLLARADARTLVCFGAGAQAVTQVAAVCAVRTIERVIVVGRSQEGLNRFQNLIRDDYPEIALKIELSQDAARVREADVVCTATTSTTPVFDDADVRPGTHINGVGSFTTGMQEIPATTVTRAKVVVDAREAALAEAGDLAIPIQNGQFTADDIHGELGQIVHGSLEGRRSREEVTFFKSVGNAIQDVVVGRRAVDEARRQGIGRDITI